MSSSRLLSRIFFYPWIVYLRAERKSTIFSEKVEIFCLSWYNGFSEEVVING
ncbi:hypothetical protein [Acutalibacter phage Fontainebleau]|nr:hypothetical protein [Acutalibacter phage Fontainebleau]